MKLVGVGVSAVMVGETNCVKIGELDRKKLDGVDEDPP